MQLHRLCKVAALAATGAVLYYVATDWDRVPVAAEFLVVFMPALLWHKSQTKIIGRSVAATLSVFVLIVAGAVVIRWRQVDLAGMLVILLAYAFALRVMRGAPVWRFLLAAALGMACILPLLSGLLAAGLPEAGSTFHAAVLKAHHAAGALPDQGAAYGTDFTFGIISVFGVLSSGVVGAALYAVFRHHAYGANRQEGISHLEGLAAVQLMALLAFLT